MRALAFRRPLVAFYLLTFSITWIGVALVVSVGGDAATSLSPHQFVFVFASMALGPFVAGLVLTAWLDGSAGVAALVTRLLRWRCSPGIWLTGLAIAPGAALIALTSLALLLDPSYAPRFQISLFAIGVVAACFEEVGWTGFAAPRLLARWRWGLSGLVLGVLWALWHMAADYAGNGASMGPSWPVWFLIFWLAPLPAYRMLMMRWMEKSRCGAIAVAMHASYTGWLFVLSPQMPLEKALIWQGLFALLLWVIVIVLLTWDVRSLRPRTRREAENPT